MLFALDAFVISLALAWLGVFLLNCVERGRLNCGGEILAGVIGVIALLIAIDIFGCVLITLLELC